MVPDSRDLEASGDVDAMPLFEGDNGLLHVRQHAAPAAEVAYLALADQGIDLLNLDVEQFLHRFLDLRFGGVRRYPEDHLVALGGKCRLLGDDRRSDDVVVARIVGRHFSRASSASSAALVRTSVFRRRMS